MLFLYSEFGGKTFDPVHMTHKSQPVVWSADHSWSMTILPVNYGLQAHAPTLQGEPALALQPRAIPTPVSLCSSHCDEQGASWARSASGGRTWLCILPLHPHPGQRNNTPRNCSPGMTANGGQWLLVVGVMEPGKHPPSSSCPAPTSQPPSHIPTLLLHPDTPFHPLLHPYHHHRWLAGGPQKGLH